MAYPLAAVVGRFGVFVLIGAAGLILHRRLLV